MRISQLQTDSVHGIRHLLWSVASHVLLDGIAKQLAPRLLGTPGETLGAREYLVRTGNRRLHTIRITSLGSATARRLSIPSEFPPPPPASSTALRSSCAPATRRRLGLRGAGTG